MWCTDRAPTSVWTILRSVGVLLVGLLFSTSCQNQTADVRTRPQDLMEAPSEHVGETVVISGEVDRVFTSRAFTVGGEEFARDLLILSTDPIAKVSGRTEEVPVGESDIVQVTGVVQRLDPAVFRENYDVRLPDKVASEYEDKPVVVALQGSNAMHGIVVSPRLPAEDYGTVNDLATATDSSLQERLRGRVAALPSVPVQNIIRDRMFWVGPSADERMLVVANPESTPGMQRGNAQVPKAGEKWRLHGVFRKKLPAPGILRAEWGLEDDLVSTLVKHEVYLHAIEAEPTSRSPDES